MYVVVSPAGPDGYALSFLDDSGEEEQQGELVATDELGEAVEAIELESPRWVWHDTAATYSQILEAGVRVERCHDLRLTIALLRLSSLTSGTGLAMSPPGPWDTAITSPKPSVAGNRSGNELSFDDDKPEGFGTGRDSSGEDDAGSDNAEGNASGVAQPTIDEFRLQLETVRAATEPNRLRLLIAAESAGALIAAEMTHAGLPWREDVHDALLTELLGPRVAPGLRPARLEQLATIIQHELGSPGLNTDSPAEVLKALRAAGLSAETTRSWELQALDHPVIEPLLEYKKLSRLLSANGWSWMESWVTDGRFSPEYVPGGVVSGRWATRGGGALQLPKQVRRAVTADEGWKLVVADAAQLEPRILAGVSGDLIMARAGQGADLYAGIVASGAVESRAQAKVAMLGAMYGATTGESGRLLPRLAAAFPAALTFVEDAARAGERGEVVTSRLGRSSPRPGEDWWEAQAAAREGAGSERERQRARQQARDWGRFTRNFVVQASAADWALCWMADLRRRLCALGTAALGTAALGTADLGTAALETAALGTAALGTAALATAHGPGRAAEPFGTVPHLVFFLHDEVIVHAPESLAEAVADALRSASASATKLLFGEFPLTVPLDVSIVDSYADAA
ncbi:bifunctional 3'-5' exonuclease/DNA polymerase [Subtercola sp. PAMC28395]|uniref:bifunctional 3'-5' exonuclease/DNA polymerase n=1 Tax=Subtercola sp. PAMC28395 TaxID=2846775 RepID=UPI001C0E140B|nr:bifunctional 3'-5' exonuclease/DNA polymerase [Subtercola sp. PAMC28395]QWT23702.1 bifunctional 3'-5' exonuclease/DNA polymerase [Subtercola sp. PAMC28395]